MPKYKIKYDIGRRRPLSLGTLFYNDDEEAIEAFRKLADRGQVMELWRPDRERLLARVDADGRFERIAEEA